MESEPEYMAKARAQLSTGNMSNNAKGYAEPSSDTFTENMINRLHAVLSTLGDAEADLTMLNDRMFGPSVQSQAPSSGPLGPSTGPSRAEILFEMVESIQRRASSVTSLARGLNSRI